MNMAEAMDYISCSICLDLLKDPVTIPCGHSYCLGCIKGCWDGDDQAGVYSCPQCRQTFIPKPALNRNTMLVELVEKLKKTGPQAAPPAHCYAGPGDVECDVCPGRKHKALKSCLLLCLASYCETHLKLHNDLDPGNRHQVVDVTGQLQEKICSDHKLLEVYCRTDQQCICLMCLVDEHKGHDTVSAAAERTEKQRKLGENLRKSQQTIQEREKEVQEVKQAICSLKSSAQAAVEDSDRTFTELIRSMEMRRSEVREMIKAQEKAEVSQAEGLLRRLEQELAELRRTDAELEQLSHTKDHIHFLQIFQSLPARSEELIITVNPQVSFEALNTFISEVAERLQDLCKEEMTKASQIVSTVGSGLHFEPKTREEFLEYSCQLTLDPNTAHNDLYLSEGNRKVTCGGKNQSYPNHPERFTRFQNVLTREALSGFCYWEVERSGRIEVAVSYKGISRKNYASDFRDNDQSCCLAVCSSKCSFWHNKADTVLPVPISSRVGVYLDHRAGTLCFYTISDSDKMTLIHRVQTTFTQPLFPGFYLHRESSLRILTPIQ